MLLLHFLAGLSLSQSRGEETSSPDSAATDSALLVPPPKCHCQHLPLPQGRDCKKEAAAGGEMHWWVPFGALLALLPGLPGSVWGEIGEIQVDISGSSVTLTCPAEEASWRHGKVEGIENPLSLSDNLEKGQMATCKAGQSTRAVYVKVKACEDCVELGLGLVAAIITSDLLITLGVLCMVYFGCKNHAATFHGRVGGAGTHGQPRDQKVDHPPPVPNPDYEPIRKGQREVYAGLGARAF